VIVVALNKAAERELKRQFREREPKKQYGRASGAPAQAEGLVDLPLICDWPNRPKQKVCYETGKAAQTEYEVLEYAPDRARAEADYRTFAAARAYSRWVIRGRPFYARLKRWP
jgi:23S rRNA-/tRNA-specific pseudouridylate synthase